MTKKVFKGFDSIFHVYLIKRITEISKKLNSHGGFLRAELARAKTSCLIGQIGLVIFNAAQKFQFFDIFVILLSSRRDKCCQIP